MNALIRLLYALLVAGSVVAFAALAIYSFYQPPKYPEYPDYSSIDYSFNEGTAEYKQQRATEDRQRKAYDTAVDKYRETERSYYHNIATALLPLAGIAAVAGIYLMRRRSEVLGEGLALGSVGIAIYAIITASLADARILRFTAACILLLVVLLIAHFRFSTPGKSTKHQLPL